MEEEGPFDGVIGFSQGAAVAARLVLLHKARDPFGPQPFKVAVFLCASSLFYANNRKEYEEKIMDVSKTEIQIPTVHVIGTKDEHRPFSLDLANLCDKRVCRVVECLMGHEIPRDLAVTEASRAAIEWAVTLSHIGA